MATTIELQERIKELEAAQSRAELLYQLSRDLNTARDEGELLQILTQPAREAGASRATLFYIDLDEADEPEWCELVAHWKQGDMSPVSVGTRYHLPGLFVAHLWLSSMDEPLLIADVASDERLEEGERDVYAGFGTQATVIIPLTRAGQWVGLLMFNWNEVHEYSERETAIYHALVGLAGPAVAARRLAKESRTRAEELAVLNELGQALTARLSTKEVLEETHRQVSRLVDATNFSVGLYDPEKHEVTLAFKSTQSEVDAQITSFSADQGLTGYMIRSRTSLLLEDNVGARQEELGIQVVGEEAMSWLGTPLVVGDRVLGAMNVQSFTTPRLYDEHDLELLTAISNQVAIALQNAEMFEETQRRVREMQLLHDVGLAVASEVRLEETLQAAVEAVTAEFEDVYGGVSLVDSESNTLRGVVATGFSTDVLANVHLKLGEGIIGWVAQNGEPALVPDVRLDPRYFDADSDTRSELCVPLVAGSQVIGILNLESSRLDAFTDDDQRLLSTLANNLAVFVERARLFDNMEQIVADRTQELQGSLEERERLQQEVIDAQRRAIQELSTPIIPVMDAPDGSGGIIIMPLIGSIDSLRARDIMRTLLAGIREHRAKIVILDITGVIIVDTGVANHLNKTIQAARLKGAHTIITGVSDAVAETIVDLGISWDEFETLSDLQTGLIVALDKMGQRIAGRPNRLA